MDNIRNHYSINKVIGHGHFGTVRITNPIGNSAMNFAVKSISKVNIKQELLLLK